MKLFDNEFPKGRFANLPISFVKIDVEGFECKVFKGASDLELPGTGQEQLSNGGVRLLVVLVS